MKSVELVDDGVLNLGVDPTPLSFLGSVTASFAGFSLSSLRALLDPRAPSSSSSSSSSSVGLYKYPNLLMILDKKY
jgi:hypothetical protein